MPPRRLGIGDRMHALECIIWLGWVDAIETHKRWLDQRMAGWLVAGVPELDRQTKRWAFSWSLFPLLFFPLLSSLVLASLAVAVAVAQFCITTHLSNHKRKRNTNQVSPLTHY